MYERYRNFWRRLGASIIDGLILMPFTTPAMLAVGYGPGWLAYSAIAILAPLPWAYTTYSHGRWGQTLGKHVTEIRVVRADNFERIGYGQALRRDAGAVIVGVLGALVMVYGIRTGDTDAYRLFDQPTFEPYEAGNEPTVGEVFRDAFSAGFPNWSEAVLTVVSSAWWVTEVVTMLTNPRRRALHDYIGGTVVVYDPAPRQARYIPPPPTPQPLAADEVNQLMALEGTRRVEPRNEPPKGTGW